MEVPLQVRKGAEKAIEAGVNTYTRYDGLKELRDAIEAKQKRMYGFEADPENEIVVSGGATGALYCACLALLNPGDEVIVFEPYYGYHISTLIASQAVPVHIKLELPGWNFDRQALARAWTPRTRAILINTPANPSGKVFTRYELQIIADFAQEHDLFVFTDEIYEHFVYGKNRHIVPAMLPGMRERTITISGLSKTFSITGWRIGYAICDARWAKTIGYFNDLIYVCAPAPLQMGVAAGLNSLGTDYYDRLSRTYESKRDRICSALERAGLPPFVPQGAYYVLADISRIPGRDSKAKAMRLLSEAAVACVPGDAFFSGNGGSRLARFCFAKEDEILEQACRKIENLRNSA
jgi:aminotransferase